MATLDEAEWTALRAMGTVRRWRRGAPLYQKGDPSDWVGLVDKGRVKVVSVSPDGYEAVLALRGPGELVGELSALDGGPRSAMVVALEPFEAVVVTADAFRGFLTAQPGVALRLLEMLALRLRDADRKRMEFGARDTVSRVAGRLVELAERYGEPSAAGTRFEMPLTQEDLAGWVGASRESVSRALRTLRSRGLVVTDGRAVVVPDLDALRTRGA